MFPPKDIYNYKQTHILMKLNQQRILLAIIFSLAITLVLSVFFYSQFSQDRYIPLPDSQDQLPDALKVGNHDSDMIFSDLYVTESYLPSFYIGMLILFFIGFLLVFYSTIDYFRDFNKK